MPENPHAMPVQPNKLSENFEWEIEILVLTTIIYNNTINKYNNKVCNNTPTTRMSVNAYTYTHIYIYIYIFIHQYSIPTMALHIDVGWTH